MAKDLDKNVLEELNKKLMFFLKISEQKGIIDGYVKRERDWKKNKTLNLKKIKDLEFDLKKLLQRIMAEIERISLRVFGRDITLQKNITALDFSKSKISKKRTRYIA